MKKINSYYWNLYKESPIGKSVVSDFKQLLYEDMSSDDLYELIKKYDKEYFVNGEDGILEGLIEEAPSIVTHCNELCSIDDYKHYYDELIDKIANDIDGYQPYRWAINYIIPISMYLHKLYPNFFIPYFFGLKFKNLQWIFDEYGIVISDMPSKFKYKERCHYYFEICEALYNFFEDNKSLNLKPEEKDAFLYGLSYEVSKIELTNFPNATPRVWFIGGWFKPREKQEGRLQWECNAQIRKGDILLFYETSLSLKPEHRSKLTSIWRADSDGIVDPFFYYYEIAYIDKKIEVPFVSLEKLYNHPIVGNIGIVRKKFNGVCGYEVKASEYKAILELISQADPSYDMATLPVLPEQTPFKECTINVEADVENYYILEMLKRMGLGEESDSNKKFLRQVPLQLGRVKKEAGGKTDFSLFPFGEDKKYADVLIETKHGRRELRNEAEVKVAFKQAESYAAHQYAGLLMLIDENKIRLYTRNSKDGVFEYTPNPKVFKWTELDNEDTFQELQNIIYSYNIHKTH